MHHEAPSRITGATGWTNTRDGSGSTGLVLPDGCMDLLWLGSGRVLVAGADTASRPVPDVPGTRIGLRFPPGHLPVALGVPADELVDRVVALNDLVPPSASGAVARAEDELALRGARVEALERLAVALGVGRAHTGLEDEVVAQVATGAAVATVADRVGLSVRQLHRRSREAFGYGPKVLARVLRLQRALSVGRGGLPAAMAAATVGYADQQHLARDVRALTGTTWTALVGRPGAAAQPSGA